MQWLGWTLLAGCAYQAGSFADHQGASSGTRTTLGCIELAVSRARDSEAGALLDYFVGNRYDQRVTIEPSRVRIVGRTGADIALTAYDPRPSLRRSSSMRCGVDVVGCGDVVGTRESGYDDV